MDLLKELPFNFRYYLITTLSNNVYILYYKSNIDVESNDSITEVETTLLDCYVKETKNNSQTLKVTCRDDEIQIKLFNENIVKYLQSKQNVNEVKIINLTTTYKIIFEPKVFEAITNCAKNLYVDLHYSAIRTTLTDYKQMDKIFFESGTLFLDKTSTIKTKVFHVRKCKIDVYNKKDNNCFINILADKLLKLENLQLYSTIKATFSNTTRSSSEYMNSKLDISYIKIFGNEFLNVDKNMERILILGFNKIIFNCLEISDEVSYGNIVKIDRVNKLSINEIKRNVKSNIKPGNMFVIGRVGSLAIHNCNLYIDKEASITDGFTIFKFLPDKEKLLTRKLSIYDSNISNNTNKNITMCYLPNVEIEKVYISKCIIENGIKLLDITPSSFLKKMYFNLCTFNLKANMFITGSTKLNFDECNIIGKDFNLNLGANIISFSKTRMEVKNLLIKTDRNFIQKFSTSGCNFEAENVTIDNSKADSSTSMFDNNSTFNVKKFIIKQMEPSFIRSYMTLEILDVKSDKTLKFTDTVMNIKDKIIDLISRCCFTGDIIITNTDPETKFKIDLDVKDKDIPMNTVNISIMGKSPEINISTNVAFLGDFNGFDRKFMFLTFKDSYSDDDPNTEITIQTNKTDETCKIINKSEKLFNYTITENPIDKTASYTFEKIIKDEDIDE